MKLAGALVLFGAALLLISGADCEICPAIKEDVELLLGPSVDKYVSFVGQYRDTPDVLENAENLKKCVDSKLTEEDKENVRSLLAKIEANKFC